MRKGGDEIALILQFDGEEQFDQKAIIEKIRSCLLGLYKTDKNNVLFPIGASIGVDSVVTDKIPEGTSLAEAMGKSVELADESMYEDKWGPNKKYKTEAGDDPRAPKNIRLAKLRAMIGELINFDTLRL